MRETYPCGIYYYFGQSLRVTNVNIKNRLITVRRGKIFHQTKTITPAVFPQLRIEENLSCPKV